MRSAYFPIYRRLHSERVRKRKRDGERERQKEGERERDMKE